MATATSGPRVLLRQLRETMAEPLASQDRLDKIVTLIATNMHTDVCSFYVLRDDNALELFATYGLKRESVRVGWESPTPEQLATVSGWAGDGQVIAQDGSVHITIDDASAFVPRLFALAPGAIRSVAIETASLEDAYFRHVTRRVPVGEGAA